MIPPDTAIGKVRLRVADIDALATFYERVVGLRAVERGGELARLGPDGGEPLVELVSAPDAPRAPSFSTGLFHLAILVPDRAELARSLQRVGGAGWRLTGASDHLVSEALYLQDPEGNGIEIYRDRPRAEWRTRDGELEMATLPMDLDGVLAALPAGVPDEGMPDGTVMGHVHLQVRDIAESGAFYSGLVGFDPVVTAYPGALFVSAGGYHHHLGLNVWGSRGAPPPPDGALGLESLRVVVPRAAEADAIGARLEAAGVAVTSVPAGVQATDPSGNRLVIAGA